MDRCRTCGWPLPGPGGCARCGSGHRGPTVLADGGDRDKRDRGSRRNDRPVENPSEPRHGEEGSDRRSPERRDRPRREGERRSRQPRNRQPRERSADSNGARHPRDRDGQSRRSRQGPRDTAPPNRPGDGRQQPSGGDDSGGVDLGRREFLLGGAGAAALATGGWWFFLRGYDGAKGVVESYLGALDSNDWGAAGSLYHSDSEFGRQSRNGQVDGYDGYLTDPLIERWEATSVDIDELYETDHVEDVEQRDGFRGFNPAEHDVSAFKRILAVVSEDRSGWDGLGPDEDAQRKTTYRYTTAKTSGGDWTMWWARR